MFELVLLVPADGVETISEALDALDALSVSVEDADAQTPAEQALFGEPGMPPPKAGWERSRVVSLFASEALARDAASVLTAQDFFAGCQLVAVQAVPEQDWIRLTQSQFTPVEITPEFWIVPTWHEPPEQAKQLIRLDPGLAFGTGTHPTTRMCLRWIAGQGAAGSADAKNVRSDGQPRASTTPSGGSVVREPTSVGAQTLGRVLDYGCGSGILAIGAAKFGAVDIDAVDIDEAAVESTRANAEANHVTLNAGLPDKAVGAYQTVLANILATPLKVLAPLLCSHVQKGGNLVLAGILERQADELKAAYQPYCQLQVLDQEEGWILMGARF
ncbi:MAG: 50S ribosomal protein L11 methyltransferase [Polaromonas sp.]|uniref:50S ribosomal protein L11 methyltransferase n=1 Tax=Polaromonas sp. TaxID=1869339 RepID=UPI002736C3A3|nr:50S ribosomal protein L11 methyltransferase [Polaromonas sp.]MDP3796665.1 50S ribosomal protein L11 methyltransferase [Polaromonas sp.]